MWKIAPKKHRQSQTPHENENHGSEDEFDLSDVEYLNEEEEVDQEQTVHHVGADCYAVRSNERTVLQCLYLKVWNTEIQKAVKVPVFLDTGSSQTFVSRKLASQLKLTLTNPRKSTVLTFGKKRTEVDLHSTKLRMSLGNDDAMTINVDVIDDLTAVMTMADPDKITETL